MTQPDEILRFWLDEHGRKDWFNGGAALDAEIKERFLPAWEKARAGGFALWLTYPNGVLAYLILTDQFPRNMFRDDPRAFELDWAAKAAAKMAISKGWDLRAEPSVRNFFYLPLTHSENLIDQERYVRLVHERLGDPDILLHAKAHRAIIRQFGRFPHRNAALGRLSTKAEQRHIAAGGYGAVLNEIRAAA